MNIRNDNWIKPVLSISKHVVIFTMLLTGLLTSNIGGFLAYIISYQIASIFRVVIYSMVFQDTLSDNMILASTYDYVDIASFITANKIPKAAFLPLYAISFSLSFLLFNSWKQHLTAPQLGVILVIGIYLIFYMLTLFMVVSPFSILPYMELVGGYGVGTAMAYGIHKIYPSALYFKPQQTLRKKMICRPKSNPKSSS